MRGLTNQQRSILLHVNAYMTSTAMAIAKDCCPESTLNAVHKKLKRLEERRYVQHIRDDRIGHVRLGVASIKDFGFSSHRTKLPGPESLPRDLTIVRHCVFGELSRDRLAMSELRCIFPDFPDHLASIPFYIDAEQRQLVAMYVLDSANTESFLERLDAERQRILSAGGSVAKLLRDRRIKFDVLTQDDVRKHEVEKLIPPSPAVHIDVYAVAPEPTEERSRS